MKNKRFIIYLMSMGTENDFENLDLLNDQGEVGGLNGGDVEVDLPVLLAFLDEV
jgi:hypothetical protein